MAPARAHPVEPAKIAIVGPGALGLALAALLREAGASVVLLDHDRSRAARLGAKTDAAELAGCRLIVVCVKASADALVARSLERAPREATIIALGNGLGRAEALAALGRERVVLGVTTIGATLSGEGRSVLYGKGPTRLAPLSKDRKARADEAAKFLTTYGIETSVENDADRLQWEKVQVNAAINALCGILDCKNGELLERKTARELAGRAAVETARVAAKLGIAGDWSDCLAVERWEAVAEASAENLCSTVQDLRARRKSEIHVINGAIARSARAAGIEAPTNELLAALIAAKEESFLSPR